MAQKILFLLLSLSFSGSLVIMLIFSINYLFRKKISYHWQYYIWIAAIARLLLPFAPAENLTGNLAGRLCTMQYQPNANTGSFDAANHSDDTDTADITDISTNNDSAAGYSADASITNAPADAAGIIGRLIARLLKIAWAGRKYLCVLWLLVFALIFLRKVTTYQNFVRFIRAGSMPIDDVSRLDALSKLEAKLGIRKAVDLWECELIPSPMLIGFLHPCIVLPKSTLSEKQLHYTMLHELAHYKRRDLYYKWAAQLALCIHWYNPLSYAMEHSINRLCELSCDEAVTAHLLEYECKEYAATLLTAMAAKGSCQEPLASITLNGNKQLLKERLESIMNKKEKNTQKKLLPAILAVAISATSFFSGSCLTGATGQPLNTDSNPSSISELNTQPVTSGTTTKNTLASLRKNGEKITASQADEMALALTNKTWVWDWVSFFVPYMSEKGVKELLPASKNSEWAGSTDMTTGKKLKFTKKQIRAARKSKPSQSLTCKDIDSHALLIMQSNGDWDCISFMLPYMSRKGIRAVVRCYNEKHGGETKKASDYY